MSKPVTVGYIVKTFMFYLGSEYIGVCRSMIV